MQQLQRGRGVHHGRVGRVAADGEVAAEAEDRPDPLAAARSSASTASIGVAACGATAHQRARSAARNRSSRCSTCPAAGPARPAASAPGTEVRAVDVVVIGLPPLRRRSRCAARLGDGGRQREDHVLGGDRRPFALFRSPCPATGRALLDEHLGALAPALSPTARTPGNQPASRWDTSGTRWARVPASSATSPSGSSCWVGRADPGPGRSLPGQRLHRVLPVLAGVADVFGARRDQSGKRCRAGRRHPRVSSTDRVVWVRYATGVSAGRSGRARRRPRSATTIVRSGASPRVPFDLLVVARARSAGGCGRRARSRAPPGAPWRPAGRWRRSTRSSRSAASRADRRRRRRARRRRRPRRRASSASESTKTAPRRSRSRTT